MLQAKVYWSNYPCNSPVSIRPVLYSWFCFKILFYCTSITCRESYRSNSQKPVAAGPTWRYCYAVVPTVQKLSKYSNKSRKTGAQCMLFMHICHKVIEGRSLEAAGIIIIISMTFWQPWNTLSRWTGLGHGSMLDRWKAGCG